MVFRRTSHLLFVVLFSLAIGACSKDKDRGSGSESGGNGNSLELGTGTVEVSGDKTGTFTGYADFSFFDIGTTQLFDINIWSYPNQTFDLSLMSWSFPEGTTPQPGTYTINSSMGNQEEIQFDGFFQIFEEGDYLNPIEYGTLWYEGEPGTLIIETAKNDQITGSFDFNASSVDDDDNIMGTINITGNFSAKISQ